MSKESYTIEGIIRILNKVPNISIKGTTVQLAKDAIFGLKVLGKLDFLKKNGYSIIIKDSKDFKKVDKSLKEDFEEPKRRKKKNEIDITSNIKSITKSANFKLKK